MQKPTGTCKGCNKGRVEDHEYIIDSLDLIYVTCCSSKVSQSILISAGKSEI